MTGCGATSEAVSGCVSIALCGLLRRDKISKYINMSECLKEKWTIRQIGVVGRAVLSVEQRSRIYYKRIYLDRKQSYKIGKSFLGSFFVGLFVCLNYVDK